MPKLPRGIAETFPDSKHHTLDSLLAAVRACRACEAHLPLGP